MTMGNRHSEAIMSNDPTIKEQYQALMDVVPSHTVLMLGALVIALGKACTALIGIRIKEGK